MWQRFISWLGAYLAVVLLVSPVLGQTTGSLSLSSSRMDVVPLTSADPVAEVVFDVESSSNVRVSVTVTDPGADVHVEGPLGQLVTPTNVELQGGASWGGETAGLWPTLPFLPGHLQVLEFPSFGAGPYKVVVDGTALSEDGAAIVVVDTDSTLALSFFTLSARSPAGTPVPLAVAISDNGQVVLGITVTVEVAKESGAPTSISLLDDGSGSDVTLGDGLYTGIFEPAEPGEYYAVATISGLRPSGESFNRVLYTSFESLPLYGLLTGTFDDSGVDDDSDGLYDWVRLNIDVEASVAGDYRAEVTLEGPTGATLNLSGVAENLPIGQQPITVPISIRELRAVADPGPYSVARVKLQYNSPTEGWLDAHLLVDLGQTAAYPVSGLKPPPIASTGFSETGVDDDLDGTFDRLAVTLDVDVTADGVYTAVLSLATSNGDVISRVNDSAYIEAGAGQIEVDFFGPDIREFGVDGPYSLASLTLSGEDDSVTVAALGTTQAYLATDFDSLTPVITRIEPAVAQPGESFSIFVDVSETDLTSGTPALDLGAGVTVSNLEVVDAGRLAADITVDGAAQLGPRDVTVTLVSGSAIAVGGFSVAMPARLVSISPAEAQQGQTVQVDIEAQNTSFVQGTTTLKLGSGVYVTALTVVDSDSISATLQLDSAAVAYLQDVTVTTGQEVVVLPAAFRVISVPAIAGVYPESGDPGETLNVTVYGSATTFLDGTVSIDFGGGITVGNIIVEGDDRLSATLTINGAAVPGPRDVTVSTANDTWTLVGGFTVDPPFSVASVTPNSRFQGTSATVTIAGVSIDFGNSHWMAG